MRQFMVLIIGFVFSAVLGLPATAGDYDHCEQIVQQGIFKQTLKDRYLSRSDISKDDLCKSLERVDDDYFNLTNDTSVEIDIWGVSGTNNLEITEEEYYFYKHNYCRSGMTKSELLDIRKDFSTQEVTGVIDAWVRCIEVVDGYAVVAKDVSVNQETSVGIDFSIDRGRVINVVGGRTVFSLYSVKVTTDGKPVVDSDGVSCSGSLMDQIEAYNTPARKRRMKLSGKISGADLDETTHLSLSCDRSMVTIQENGVSRQVRQPLDIVVDTSAGLFSFYYPGLDKTPLEQSDREKVLELIHPGDFVPVATFLPFAATSDEIPPGWRLCDGSMMPNTEAYEDLFNALGCAYGCEQDDHGNVLKFGLPDYRGYFLRASDISPVRGDRNLDTGPRVGGQGEEKIGSTQEQALAAHHHGFEMNYPQDNKGGSQVYPYTNGSNQYGSKGEAGSTAGPVGMGATGTDEVRPENIYVHYIMKVTNFFVTPVEETDAADDGS